jgi:hypothetical protein
MAYTAFGERRKGDWRVSDPLLPLSRNLLKGQVGDEINVLMAACAWNLRKWLAIATIFLFWQKLGLFFVKFLRFFAVLDKKEYKEELIKSQKQNERLTALVGKVTVEKEWLAKKLKSLGLSNRKPLVVFNG